MKIKIKDTFIIYEPSLRFYSCGYGFNPHLEPDCFSDICTDFANYPKDEEGNIIMNSEEFRKMYEWWMHEIALVNCGGCGEILNEIPEDQLKCGCQWTFVTLHYQSAWLYR